MKKNIKTLFALAFLYLVYLVVKFVVLRKKFAVSGNKATGANGAAKGQKAQNSAHHTAKNPHKNSEETVLDPVCGNYIPISSAVSLASARLPSYVLSGGETIFFCSGACRDAFMSGAGRHGSQNS